MKSKKIILIFAVILIFIVLVLRNRSQKTPTITYPPNTQKDRAIDNNTTQNGNTNQSAVSIDTDLQSLDNIVNGINNEDFAETTLDGIE